MELQKFNRLTHQYDVHVVPNDWKCTYYADELEEYCNCPHCGKRIQVKDGYTSTEIHTPCLGLGYIVCSDCYDREWERRQLCEIIDELKEAKENSNKAVKYYVDILTGLKKWLEDIRKEEIPIGGTIYNCEDIRISCVLDKIEELEGNLNGVLR